MWQEPDSYPSEPIFVSQPDALEEDDGNGINECLDFALYWNSVCSLLGKGLGWLFTNFQMVVLKLNGTAPELNFCGQVLEITTRKNKMQPTKTKTKHHSKTPSAA